MLPNLTVMNVCSSEEISSGSDEMLQVSGYFSDNLVVHSRQRVLRTGLFDIRCLYCKVVQREAEILMIIKVSVSHIISTDPVNIVE